MRSVAEQDAIPLDLVNAVRQRVTDWRAAGYPGVTRVSADLLRYWNADRQQRLFFAQREAAETVIWLVEAAPAARAGIDVPRDGGAFARYCLKLATGSSCSPRCCAWSASTSARAST